MRLWRDAAVVTGYRDTETVIPNTRFKYSCPTCHAEFVALRRSTAARCIQCGSTKAELVGSVTRLSGPVSLGNPTRIYPEGEGPRVPVLEELIKKPEVDPAHHVTTMFACIDCALKFVWNYTRRGTVDPFCPKCKGAEIKEISPRAKAIAVAKGMIPRTFSKRDLKRIRFIRNQWRMRCELRDHIESLDNLMSRCGFNSRQINDAKNMLNEMLAEVDEQQQLRLNEYDKEAVS